MKMYFLLKMGIFHGYVSLPDGIIYCLYRWNFNNGPNNKKDLDATISLLRLHDVGTSVSILGKPVSEVWMQKKRIPGRKKRAEHQTKMGWDSIATSLKAKLLFLLQSLKWRMGCFQSTPWKINMEPTNHPFRKEHDLPSTSMIMFHVNLQGCSFQIIF